MRTGTSSPSAAPECFAGARGSDRRQKRGSLMPGPPNAEQYSDEQRDPLARGGWYRDPFDAADERWWDGTKWTQKVRGAPREDAAAAGARGDAAATDRVRAMAPVGIRTAASECA